MLRTIRNQEITMTLQKEEIHRLLSRVAEMQSAGQPGEPAEFYGAVLPAPVQEPDPDAAPRNVRVFRRTNAVRMAEAEPPKSRRRRFWRVLRSTLNGLLVGTAIAIILVNYFFALIQLEGSSMSPTFERGDLVLAQRTSNVTTGDVIAFYYQNKLLLKRVIAGPGDWVDIDEDGRVSVNGVMLEEPYVSNLCYGEGDIEYPCQVGENRWFVLGDHRDVSLDSRYSAIGTISEEQIYGKVLFSIWPLTD